MTIYRWTLIAETSSPAFDEFLDLLGQRVRLKGFEKYRAQLDNKCKSFEVDWLFFR